LINVLGFADRPWNASQWSEAEIPTSKYFWACYFLVSHVQIA